MVHTLSALTETNKIRLNQEGSWSRKGHKQAYAQDDMLKQVSYQLIWGVTPDLCTHAWILRCHSESDGIQVIPREVGDVACLQQKKLHKNLVCHFKGTAIFPEDHCRIALC